MRGLLLLAVVVLVGACGTVDGPETGAEVTVQGADGPVSIPATDRGIWALGDATAVHLLALGVVPEHAARNRYQGRGRGPGERAVPAERALVAGDDPGESTPSPTARTQLAGAIPVMSVRSPVRATLTSCGL
ncbi:hypothetical protein IU433_04250 [Nocardia puris]|uniref:Uncharacterized protein n=1 Tax=Nocardia puris TaxID=208602 RepID=A0A366DYZ4_9NOCA|nr:hypothetical protein [Nocardia puris]MBF6209835.1 hypothetical protein [Nocardia puris]MBF6366407.1 hypothetical protein [Nocardia puris]MBF6458254.1 hypothetical protein [Nocardia puris]RBO94428.1 hypothetical protein DFR74_102851 [Nocardia puris]